MLKIEVLHSRQFSNDLHVQCVTEIKNLTQNSNPETLGIPVQYNDFTLWYDREEMAFVFIRRSEITKEKEIADHERDRACRGLAEYVKSVTHHYKPEVVAAAYRLQTVIETFNHPVRLTELSYDAETASISSLVENLKAHPNDVSMINLQEWLAELDSRNKAFEVLALKYIEDVVGKPEYNMLHSRRGVEDTMRTIFSCIDALVLLKGETDDYKAYVNALNAIIKHYNDVYAIHLGRYKSNE
jgi:hypothetical protein